MQAPTQLSPEWQTWLTDNLAHGCSQADLVQSMVSAHFSQDVATAVVQRAMTHPDTHQTADHTAQAYVYEQPRLPQSGNTIRTHDRDVHVTLRLAKPVVAVIDDFMAPEECDELVRLSRIKLKRSAIVDPQTGQEKVIDERSSYGTYLTLNETGLIAALPI